MELIFEALQAGGRDVIGALRSGVIRAWSSGKAFAHVFRLSGERAAYIEEERAYDI
jgi:hypothetical protein